MKQWIVVLAVGILACNNPDIPNRTQVPVFPSGLRDPQRVPRPLVNSPEAESEGLPPVEAREMSPQEDALIRDLEQLFAGTPRANEIRRTLSDPRVSRVDMPSNPRAQAILKRIQSIREAEADRAFANHQRDPKVAPVTIAVAEHFPFQDSTVVAAILRRPNQDPRDIVVLRASRAGAGVLGAALRMLNISRARDGLQVVRPLVLVVKGDNMPSTWNQDGLREQATTDLRQLMGSPQIDLSGVGRARVKEILLRIPRAAR